MNTHSSARPAGALRIASGFYIVAFGFLLPLIAAAVEWQTNICADAFFDPLPTVWHLAVFLFIPAGNLLVWGASASQPVRWRKLLGLVNAMALALAGVYTVVFLPILPVSIIGILFAGLGFCGLAPLLALLAGVACRRRLRGDPDEDGKRRRPPLLVTGLAAGVLLLGAAELPRLVTHYGLSMAADSDPEYSRQGVDLLRAVGSEAVLLRACEPAGRRPAPLFADRIWSKVASMPPPDRCRDVFYRVTGQDSANMTERGSGGWFGPADMREFDMLQGGRVVGSVLTGLELSKSRMEGTLHGDEAVGYVEWTLVFRNEFYDQREARALLRLPPDGVVSRLTLWIDGQPHEAAFGGRCQTSGAYKAVVERKRDPVLVTTDGPDRVLVQCFPVPPNGGTMQIRVGIAFPLTLDHAGQAGCVLPTFDRRNFAVDDDFRHTVELSASSELTAVRNEGVTLAADGRRLVARPTTADLGGAGGRYRVARWPGARLSVSAIPGRDGQAVLQTIVDEPQRPPERIIVVVDTSVWMKGVLEPVGRALEALPPSADVVMLLAGDTVRQVGPRQPMQPHVAREFRDALADASAAGGTDAVPALKRAIELAGDGRAHILWVHGSQPVELAPGSGLEWAMLQVRETLLLHDLQVGPGVNVASTAVEGLSCLRTLPVASAETVESDLRALLASLEGPQWRIQRERVAAADAPADASAGPVHVVSVWARDEVDRLVNAGDQAAAGDLAVTQRIVTRISGAVVLETRAQYEAAGLEPHQAPAPHATPEPGTLVLLAAGGGALLVWRRRRRAARRAR